MRESKPRPVRRGDVAFLIAFSLLAGCGGGGGGGGGDRDPGPGPGDPTQSGVPEFTADSFTFDENAGTVTVTVQRFDENSAAIASQLVLIDATTGARATENVDFTLASSTVEFAAGDFTPKTVTLNILNDAGNEPVESLTLQLQRFASRTRNGATIESRRRTTINIRDNDPVTTASARFEPKRLVFALNANPEATFFRAVFVGDGFQGQFGSDIPASARSFPVDLAFHLQEPQAEFRIDACNAVGCVASAQTTKVDLADSVLATGYLKASDRAAAASLGMAVAISGDGSTVVIGAPAANNGAGAVYVYKRPADKSAVLGRQPVKIAAPSNDPMRFGAAVALNNDGTVLAVGAPADSNSVRTDNRYPATPVMDVPASGGVFVYQGTADGWSMTPSYFKKLGIRNAQDVFGSALAMAPDGRALVVGAPGEDSSSGLGQNTDAPDSGTVYVMNRDSLDELFSVGLPLKPDMPEAGARFGSALAISKNFGGAGTTTFNTQFLVVGAPAAAANAGAAYLFIERLQDNFTAAVPTLRIPAPAPAAGNLFGAAVAISEDASTIVIGAPGESSVLPRTVGGNGRNSGAAFVYRTADLVNERVAAPAFLKARTPRAEARYGASLAVSSSGDVIAVGAVGESAKQIGVGSPEDGVELAAGAGAVEVATRPGFVDWSGFTDPAGDLQPTKRYVKATNTDANDHFGTSVASSRDGATLIVGAPGEDGNNVNFTDPGRNEADNTLTDSGAAYLY